MSIKPKTKVCGVAVLVLLIIFAALGPAKYQLRSGLGWQVDHVVGYFAFTLMVCLVWPRARVVGGAVMAFAVLLEGLQAFTPDRMADLHAALYSSGGVLAAALPADFFIRAPRRPNGRTLLSDCFRAALAISNNARTSLLTACRRARVPGGFGAMPAGLIENENGVGTGCPVFGTYRTEQIGRLGALIVGGAATRGATNRREAHRLRGAVPGDCRQVALRKPNSSPELARRHVDQHQGIPSRLLA
jgi:VanZ family protein